LEFSSGKAITKSECYNPNITENSNNVDLDLGYTIDNDLVEFSG
jgi:hypothetical protein